MIEHTSLGPKRLFHLLHSGKISMTGNKRLKIYGQLNCRSGKRMNKRNRVFFIKEEDAIKAGFRPCGYCMREAYKKWKNGVV